MALIFGTSSIPDLQRLPGNISDKTAHGLAYAMLGAALLWGTTDRRRRAVRASSAVAAVAGAAAYGAFDEVHQWFVPGRTMSLADWAADVIGATAAVVVLAVLARVLRAAGRAV